MQTATRYPEMDTPEFHAKADALIAAEQAKFDAWLAEDRFGDLIDGALAKAKDAYQAALDGPEMDDPTDTFALIALDGRRSKPLIQALAERNIGEFDTAHYCYHLHVSDIVKRGRTSHWAAYNACVEAFALALSEPGFEFSIWRQ